MQHECVGLASTGFQGLATDYLNRSHFKQCLNHDVIIGHLLPAGRPPACLGALHALHIVIDDDETLKSDG